MSIMHIFTTCGIVNTSFCQLFRVLLLLRSIQGIKYNASIAIKKTIGLAWQRFRSKKNTFGVRRDSSAVQFTYIRETKHTYSKCRTAAYENNSLLRTPISMILPHKMPRKNISLENSRKYGQIDRQTDRLGDVVVMRDS